MTTKELAKEVLEMRQRQIQYFKSRDREDLQRSKEQEKRIDRLIAAILDDSPQGVFDLLPPYQDS